jgi:uncharacterized protein involved in response to NO
MDLQTLMQGNPASSTAPRVALFEYGFRPFFLAAGLYAALSLFAWLAIWFGFADWYGPWAGPRWHAHEMIFGFALAGVAGFMLTAIPGWTGTSARRGVPLAMLVLLWLAGRAAMWASAAVPAPLVAALDLAFLPGLALAVAGPLIGKARAARSPRNLVFLVFIAVLWTADLFMQLDPLGVTANAGAIGERLGRDCLLLMIGLVGGRIIPAFTRNTLKAEGQEAAPRSFLALDAVALGGLALMLLADVAFGEGAISGVLAAIAALANGCRLAFWQPLRTRAQPMLWVLHLGYAWLVAGLALKAASDLGGWVPDMAAMHALAVGAIGTMLVAVMSRAGLGHTGRRIVASPATVAAYVLISVAAVLRVLATFLLDLYGPLVAASGLLWCLAFALFAAVYLPVLVSPRADGRPG